MQRAVHMVKEFWTLLMVINLWFMYVLMSLTWWFDKIQQYDVPAHAPLIPKSAMCNTSWYTITISSHWACIFINVIILWSSHWETPHWACLHVHCILHQLSEKCYHDHNLSSHMYTGYYVTLYTLTETKKTFAIHNSVANFREHISCIRISSLANRSSYISITLIDHFNISLW